MPEVVRRYGSTHRGGFDLGSRGEILLPLSDEKCNNGKIYVKIPFFCCILDFPNSTIQRIHPQPLLSKKIN